jgi:hypothetical protein
MAAVRCWEFANFLRTGYWLDAMHVPASAVTLARSMLSLSRSRATGVLSVRSDPAVGRFAFVDGALRAAVSNAPQPSLGDVLVQSLGCDPQTLAAAFEHAEFQPPAGAWLVQRGLASRETVARALREQLRERVRAAFRWPRHELRFDAGPAEVGVYWLREPLATEPLVLSGMRAAVSSQPGFEPELTMRGTELTAWGRSLVDAGSMSEAERSLADALQRGATGAELLAAAHSGERVYRTWCALRAFGAVVTKAETRVHYTLLLRKRAQLRRSANARELLDLPPGAYVGKDAPRRALRRLAMHLHPDRLGPDAPESARTLSTEVMQALTRAASMLQSAQ